MGKAADNERIKLRATWYNNVSVGLFVAGVFVPYLTLFQKLPEHMAGDRLQLTNLSSQPAPTARHYE